MNYFNKLPTIIYDGQVAKNIMARAALSAETKANRTSFYPYTMDGNDRADTLSNLYYDNPGYTWLIWMANETIDPYYGLNLSEDDFVSYMTSKYGSMERAMRKTAFYRVKEDRDLRITIAGYEALPHRFKRYYEPTFDVNGSVSGYKRKAYLDTTTTNMIVSITLATVNENFTVGEEIQVDGTHYATVTLVDGNVITCQHVNGGFEIGDTIVGQDSRSSGTITAINTIAETVAFTDAAYWQPVSYFDYEYETNEQKKEITLLDVRYKGQVEAEFKRVMRAR
jgi:hypothetical protein